MGRTLPIVPFADLLVASADRDPAAEAFVIGRDRRTYGGGLDRAFEVGRSLLALGVRKGDRVGILMPNCIDFIDWMFASSLIGAVVVPINARFRSRELAYVIADAAISVLATTDLEGEYTDLLPRLHGALPDLAAASQPRELRLGEFPALRTVVVLGSPNAGCLGRADFDALAAEVDRGYAEAQRRRIAIRDPAFMFYTSGTTAMPKGCLLTHESLVRVGLWTKATMGVREGDRIWDPLPLFHTAATQPMAAILAAGGCYISMSHFTPGGALEQIRDEHATLMFPAFPTITQALLNHPTYDESTFKNIRVIFNVATPGALREMQDRMPHTTQVSAYGMTEFGGSVVMNRPDDHVDVRCETVGPAFPGIEVCIVDTETGAPLPTGERGEILLRGPTQFVGYHNAPEKNSEAVDEDGWFHSGDLGSLDSEGRLRYLGRTKDMLKVGGENVAALEIESYLAQHPAVSIAQVVGVPDDTYLEVAAVFIECVPGAAVTPDEIIAYCAEGLARFKVPRYVRFVSEWPMSATKIQKFALRDQLLAELHG